MFQPVSGISQITVARLLGDSHSIATESGGGSRVDRAPRREQEHPWESRHLTGQNPIPEGVSGRGLSALSKTPERRDSAQDLSAHGAHASLGFVDITDSYPRQAIVKRHLSPRPEPRRNCSSRSAIWRTVPAGSYSSPYQAIDVPPNTWFRSAGDRAWVRDSARPTTSE